MTKQFFRYVSQSMLSMIGLSVYILADTFFIALYAGADGITVLNLMLPLFGFIYAIAAMIGIGSATRWSLRKLQGEPASLYFSNSLLWQFLFSIPFVCVGVFSPESYLRLMGGDAEIVRQGIGYARTIFLGAPFFMANYSFTSFARNDEAPTIVMIGSLAGSGFNILFDYLFMFPLQMGLRGAALATLFSPIVTILITMTHYLSPRSHVSFRLQRPSLRLLLTSCQLGFSAFVGEIASAVTITVFNFLLLDLAGNVGVAAYGVIANIALVANSLFNGIAQGTQPLLSRSHGAGNFREVRKLLQLGCLTTLVMEALVLLLAFLQTEPLVAVFNSEGNAVLRDYAVPGLRWYFSGYLIAGLNIFLINYYSATGQGRQAFIASLLRGVVAISLFAILLSLLFGITGVWASFLAAELATGLISLGMSKIGRHS